MWRLRGAVHARRNHRGPAERGAHVSDPLNIVIAGVGGQGNILASQILATATVREGLFVNVGETYGASQRGGMASRRL
jgi:hypothetical protein